MRDLDKDKRYIHKVLNKMEIDDEEKFMSAVANVIFENNKELKKWKEIAEILASEYAKHVICRNTVGGISFREVEELLDWARKEVEK